MCYILPSTVFANFCEREKVGFGPLRDSNTLPKVARKIKHSRRRRQITYQTTKMSFIVNKHYSVRNYSSHLQHEESIDPHVIRCGIPWKDPLNLYSPIGTRTRSFSVATLNTFSGWIKEWGTPQDWRCTSPSCTEHGRASQTDWSPRRWTRSWRIFTARPASYPKETRNPLSKETASMLSSPAKRSQWTIRVKSS